MDFTHALDRTPGRSLVAGITTADLGQPDHGMALKQHAAYIQALEGCGFQVRVLDASEAYPDSTFIEDVALLTPQCAILLNPGAPSRKGETAGMDKVLGEYFPQVHRIEEPATVEGGDILQVEDHFTIGLTERTNRMGAEKVIEILERSGLSGSVVPVQDMLHLKTGIASLSRHLVIADQALLAHPAFQDFPTLRVNPEEAYAANCLEINGTVLLPAGFPRTRRLLQDAGYDVAAVDVTEFRKLDGGLSCLSLRF